MFGLEYNTESHWPAGSLGSFFLRLLGRFGSVIVALRVVVFIRGVIHHLTPARSSPDTEW